MKVVGIIGLGYVGLPLAIEFGKTYRTIGFDIKKDRITELKEGYDRTLEVDKSSLISDKLQLLFTSNMDDLSECQIYIITVPTPVDKNNRPDLTPLYKASEIVGKVLKQGDVVVYESTVYPGVTEDECVPVLEKISGLVFNKDFFCGYSPERINPGDKEHVLTNIRKITSGSNPQTAEEIDQLYASIIKAGTFKAPSIKVAEAAKVIENAQRDINIAFVNELAKIFNCLNIDTKSVLEAAGTKWNFLKFMPGLVGGHCIGVDPYYLAQKAQEAGYHPEIILAGRRINDGMGGYIAQQVVKLMVNQNKIIKGSKVLILGITFKENCPDVRNSRVIDIISELRTFGVTVMVYDPWASATEVIHEYSTKLSSIDEIGQHKYDGVILAVAHEKFREIDFEKFRNEGAILYDVKSFLSKEVVDGRL